MAGRGTGWGQIREIPATKKSTRSYGIRYRGPDGKRYSGRQTFTTKGAARAALDQIKATIDDGTWMPPAEAKKRAAEAKAREEARATTLRDWTEEWLTLKRQGFALPNGKRVRPVDESTVITYRSKLKHALEHETTEGTQLGDLQLGEITTAHVTALLAELEALKSRYASTGNGVARQVAQALKMALDDAVRLGKIDAAPIVSVPPKMAVRKRENQDDHVATHEEIQALYEAMPERWRIVVLLGVWCQLRFGEALALQRQDIVWHAEDRAEIRVRWQIVSKTGEREAPKSEASIRDIAVPSRMIKALREHLDTHTGKAPSAYLLHPTGDDRVNLSTSVLDRAWRKARDTAAKKHPDLVGFRFHDLRHTGLTYVGQAGATLAELMHRAGHKDLKAVAIYQHSTKDRDQALAAAL